MTFVYACNTFLDLEGSSSSLVLLIPLFCLVLFDSFLVLRSFLCTLQNWPPLTWHAHCACKQYVSTIDRFDLNSLTFSFYVSNSMLLALPFSGIGSMGSAVFNIQVLHLAFKLQFLAFWTFWSLTNGILILCVWMSGQSSYYLVRDKNKTNKLKT